MRTFLSIITILLFQKGVSAQQLKSTNFLNDDTLKIINVTEEFLLTSKFYYGGIFVSYNYEFKSNGKFRVSESGCMTSDLTIENGKWKILKGNLLLKSKEAKMYFKVFKFDNFLFLVDKTKESDFKNDFRKIKIEVSSANLDPNNKQYTIGSWIAFELQKTFPSFELLTNGI
ncbi:MAG: hypothetical protein IPP99_15825 [Chitinophagaceae bacterium]|nr:hypothetical protein [Chitinophagaceae bacterium]